MTSMSIVLVRLDFHANEIFSSSNELSSVTDRIKTKEKFCPRRIFGLTEIRLILYLYYFETCFLDIVTYVVRRYRNFFNTVSLKDHL